MTSSTPVRPLYPLNETSPPPRKRRKNEGEQTDEELSNEEFENDRNDSSYEPMGGSGDEDPEAARAEFEDPDLFANKESDDSKFANKESNFECPPMRRTNPENAQLSGQAFGGGHSAAFHQWPPALQELV